MRVWTRLGLLAAALAMTAGARQAVIQPPVVLPVPEATLREYAGAYQWSSDHFVYLQLWNELSGANQLVAFDESGEVRALYPFERDRFFAGPGAAIPSTIESRVQFERDSAGRIARLSWLREGAKARVARRIETEAREDVRFSNGPVRLAGTLIKPARGTKHPVVILVHPSGAADRDWMLPYARFLIRHGLAVLGYDKRGVRASTGDWTTASFDDLAADLVAAFAYLKTREDVDPERIGFMGVSQAGWVMPLAAVRAKDAAFLISISGAGVPAAETTIDQTRNEMTARGMKPRVIDQIVGLMARQYEFARTGQGWDGYLEMRAKLAARMGGTPPETFPAAPDHPHFELIRRLYFYDPAPTLRQVRTPTLALFGELDRNIMAEKNTAAWDAALRAGGHRDYTLRILPSATHLQLEGQTGSNLEMASLQRFVPAYFTTVREWLATRRFVRD